MEVAKPLSERKTGLLIAAIAGIAGGPIGLVASPLVLHLLTRFIKPKDGKAPNRTSAPGSNSSATAQAGGDPTANARAKNAGPVYWRAEKYIDKMPIRIFAILAVIGSPFCAFASQLFYKCKYPATWVEYSIDARTNTIKEYSEMFFSVREEPISYISPTRIAWSKKNKLGPRPNYNYPDKMVHEEHNYSHELNIEKGVLTTLQKSCDYAEGRCWAKTNTYKCFKIK